MFDPVPEAIAPALFAHWWRRTCRTRMREVQGAAEAAGRRPGESTTEEPWRSTTTT
jgi:hypothetical protein